MKNYKVLIIAPAWVGDVVMSQVLLKLLKTKYGNNLILDVLVNNNLADLIGRMSEVNNVIRVDFSRGKLDLWKRIRCGRHLRKACYDQVFVLPNSLKSALIPFFAKIKIRTGFVGEFRYGFINEIYKLYVHKLPRLIDRYSALGNHGLLVTDIIDPSLDVDFENQKKLFKQFNIVLNNRKMIVLCVGAEYGPAKRWPAHYFASLTNMLLARGYIVVVLGSSNDKKTGEEISLVTNISRNNFYNLCGETRLVDVVDLLAASTLVVTNDTGLMHVACAVGALVLAIYGSSSPSYTPPLSNSARILKIDMECAPCFARTCKFNHYNCLKLLTVQMVFDNIMKMLS